MVALEISEPDLGPPSRSGAGGGGETPATDPIVVDVQVAAVNGGLIGRLKDLLAAYPGELPVIVRVTAGPWRSVRSQGAGDRSIGRWLSATIERG